MTLERLIETQRLAHELMSEFGLIEQGWTFRFGNTKDAFGRCFHDGKYIEISKWFVESSWDEVEDTIRHEIAHALVSSEHGHDHVWRMKAIEVGANPTRCYDSESDKVTFNGNYNYLLICPECDKRWRRHRMKLKSPRCQRCHVDLQIVDLRR